MNEVDKVIRLFYLYNCTATEIYSKIKNEYPSVTRAYVQSAVDSLDDELDTFINTYGVIVHD